MQRKKLIQRYYSKRAKDYDQQKIRTWKSKQGFEAEIINEITDAFASLKSKIVLEVGVGSGRISSSLLENTCSWLVGLDLSREMLSLAKAKMFTYKQRFDLILGDAEHLPFANEIFDAIICISTMHYFEFPKKSLTEFSRTSTTKGIFVYGDLTMHELDKHAFLERLEKTLSKAHAIYYRLSEAKKLLQSHGFQVARVQVFPYRKSYSALIEDKGKYFNVKPETFRKIIQEATIDEKKLYNVGNSELTLFYALVAAVKGE